MTNIDFIKAQLPLKEILAQLAEESAELGKAALKLRRVIDGTNPTPVTLVQATENLAEEIADVLLCLAVIGFDLDELEEFRPAMNIKLQRWVNRLLEVERSADDGK